MSVSALSVSVHAVGKRSGVASADPDNGTAPIFLGVHAMAIELRIHGSKNEREEGKKKKKKKKKNKGIGIFLSLPNARHI